MPDLKSRLDANQVLRNSYDDDKDALRVLAEISATIGDIDISIDAQAGDNIAIADPTGTNYILPNPDGSLNVVITDSGLTTKNLFNEITGIAAGVTAQIFSYTAISNTNLLSLDVGGTNVASYSLYIGGDLAAKKYTYFQNLNERFDFGAGLPVAVGDQIMVEVVHARPDLGDFNVNALIKN